MVRNSDWIEAGYPFSSARVETAEKALRADIAETGRAQAALVREGMAHGQNMRGIGFRAGWAAGHTRALVLLREAIAAGRVIVNDIRVLSDIFPTLPEGATASPEPESDEPDEDARPARECPNCGGDMEYRVRGEDLGWDCDNCGRPHRA